jgi:hypothetical protein
MISIKFIWYDLWMGIYIDTKTKQIYICPLPCIVIKINLNSRQFRNKILKWNVPKCFKMEV